MQIADDLKRTLKFNHICDPQRPVQFFADIPGTIRKLRQELILYLTIIVDVSLYTSLCNLYLLLNFNTNALSATKLHASLYLFIVSSSTLYSFFETAKSAYNNGILEITFKKKEQTKGKTIKIE